MLVIPQVTLISTFGITVATGTTTLEIKEQKAICLANELSVSAPVGSCVFLGTSTSPDGLLSPIPSSPPVALVLSTKGHKIYMKSHTHHHMEASTSTLYATTKIEAPANQFKSYSQLQNVSVLVDQIKSSLDAAVSGGNFTLALQTNSRKFNATATTTAIVTSTNTASLLYSFPTIQPTTPFAPFTNSGSSDGSSSQRNSSGLTATAKYGIIGGVVGGFAVFAVIGFMAIFYRKNKTKSLSRHRSQQAMLMDLKSESGGDLKSASTDGQLLFVDSRIET
jgi:hypothetical protein